MFVLLIAQVKLLLTMWKYVQNIFP